MTWRSDARALCAEIHNTYGLGLTNVCNCVTHTLDAGDEGAALSHLAHLARELSGAWSLATVHARELVDDLHGLVLRAQAIAHAGHMDPERADTEPPPDTVRDPDWASDECEAVQEGGTLEHLRDVRETGAVVDAEGYE